jgi:MFS family permease
MTVLLGLGTGLIYPSINAFAAHVWPEGRRAAFNAIYVASNVGVAVGSMAGGLLAQMHFWLAFGVTGTIFLIYAITVLLGWRGQAFRNVAERRTDPAAPQAATASSGLWRLAPWLLALGLFLDWTAYVQWQVTVPVHMLALGYPLSRYSLLWTLNGLLILAGQPLVSFVTRRLPAVKAQVLLGNALFILSFLLLPTARAYVSFLAGMALSTFGEMFVWPGVPAAADRMAPPGRRGLYQGLISGAGSAGRAAGPLFGGLLYDSVPTGTLFLVMVGVFALGLAVFAIYDRFRRPAAPAAASGTETV